MTPRPRFMPMVQASRDEASLAVRLYNDPSEARSFEGFVVHMHVAWLYLLHAEFERDGADYRYHRKDKPRLLVRIDGEVKRWELARSVEERWPDPDYPPRRNLDFWIKLRNKIEHRFGRQQQELDVALAGHAQALLLNYEEELTSQFGQSFSLATRLRFPVFIGSFTRQGEATLRRLHKALPAELRTFIADYHAGLSDSVERDSRFEFRLRLVNELAPRDPDALAIQFTRYDDMTDEQRAAVEELGRKGMVIVRERKRRVVNLDLKRPKEIIAEVAAQIPFVFHMGHFTKSWRKLNVRPRGGASKPEVTDDKYCFYDARHRDYGYTAAYVSKLVRKLSTEEGWRALLEEAPKSKATGEWVGEPPPKRIPPQWRRYESSDTDELEQRPPL